jgi:hypothetical protein
VFPQLRTDRSVISIAKILPPDWSDVDPNALRAPFDSIEP